MIKARISLIVVGLISILVSFLGFGYNLMSSILCFEQDPPIPYFNFVFSVMSIICVACYIILFYCGIQLIRQNPKIIRLFIRVIIFEIIYFISLLSISVVFVFKPNICNSIEAAIGVANVGLMYQFVILFPLWAPFLAKWGFKELIKTNEENLGCS